MTSAPQTCPACGSPGSGNFCSACGASLVARSCAGCGADLAATAKFCHRCGRPAGGPPANTGTRAAPAPLPKRERVAWLVAGLTCVVLVGLIVFKVGRPPAPVAPDMANAGAESARETGSPPQSQGSPAGPAGPAPDISRMTPRERFDRLFNRVMQAAEQGDTSQIVRFTPMALGAYAQLDSVNTDARYHAAVLRLQIGDLPGAVALADTILAQSPGHLFGYIVRGEAAGYRGDTAVERLAGRQFLAGYEAERRTDRIEYREHEPAIEDFKRKAEALRP